MPKTAQVTLGGRTYIVKEKPMGASGVWRERLRKSRAMLIFESLDTAMIQLVAVADSTLETDAEGTAKGWQNVDVNQVIGVAKILPVLVNGLSNSIDEIEALLFEYSPELAADRAWLGENAYDTEAIMAFCEVLKLCFPIMAVLELMRGPRAAQTATSLPLPNGASGRPSVGHRKKT